MFIGPLPPLREFRILYIAGGYGTGKTALAVELARYWHRRAGYRIVSNVPGDGLFVPSSPFELERHSIIILDEASDCLDAYDSTARLRVLSAFRYVRHLDWMVISASADTVQKRLRRLVCQREFSFGRVWGFRWWPGPSADLPSGRQLRHLRSSLFLFYPTRFSYDSLYMDQVIATDYILSAMVRTLQLVRGGMRDVQS